ncbi:MAG: hypothetical protein AAF682_29505 [Planctomycetota bacterium]
MHVPHTAGPASNVLSHAARRRNAAPPPPPNQGVTGTQVQRREAPAADPGAADRSERMRDRIELLRARLRSSDAGREVPTRPQEGRVVGIQSIQRNLGAGGPNAAPDVPADPEPPATSVQSAEVAVRGEGDDDGPPRLILSNIVRMVRAGLRDLGQAGGGQNEGAVESDLRGIGRDFRHSLREIRERVASGELDRGDMADEVRSTFEGMLADLNALLAEPDVTPEEPPAPEPAPQSITFSGTFQFQADFGGGQEPGPGAIQESTPDAGVEEPPATAAAEQAPIDSRLPNEEAPARPELQIRELLRDFTDRFQSLIDELTSALLPSSEADAVADVPATSGADEPQSDPQVAVSVFAEIQFSFTATLPGSQLDAAG